MVYFTLRFMLPSESYGIMNNDETLFSQDTVPPFALKPLDKDQMVENY